MVKLFALKFKTDFQQLFFFTITTLVTLFVFSNYNSTLQGMKRALYNIIYFPIDELSCWISFFNIINFKYFSSIKVNWAIEAERKALGFSQQVLVGVKSFLMLRRILNFFPVFYCWDDSISLFQHTFDKWGFKKIFLQVKSTTLQ